MCPFYEQSTFYNDCTKADYNIYLKMQKLLRKQSLKIISDNWIMLL